jgi:hypothetical protein
VPKAHKRNRYILRTGARGGWTDHIRKPHIEVNGYVTIPTGMPRQNPGRLVGLNGMSLPQNVYEARGRGRSLNGEKRRLYRERQDKPGRGLLSAA